MVSNAKLRPYSVVEHRVARAIGRTRAPIRLAALAVVQALAAERALVDLAVLGPREGQAVRLELEDRARRLAAHVVDGVLVAQPVRPLDRVVHVPAPVVFGHVAERGVDAALRRDRVAARREKLRHTGRLEAGLRGAHGRPESSSTRTHHDDVV